MTKERDPRFRFAPDILRRLGEELVSSPSQGILELVKNAYDADATRCSVHLKNRGGGIRSIKIEDNGNGMLRDEIINGWLILGRSSKTTRKYTRLGRTPSGSKGLGRLAALRLGDTALLETRPLKEPEHSYSLTIDWSRFNNAEVVEDVPLNIKTTSRSRPTSPGTTITLDKLRIDIGRVEVKKIARALILLADPFGDDSHGFEPVLKAPEYRDLEQLVKGRYFSDAEYHLVASINGEGIATAEVVDWKSDQLFAASHKDLRPKKPDQPYSCPAVRFEFWAFILNNKSFTGRTATVGEVRRWLKEFGGVHIYEGNLRVAPYGDPGNDWLDLNLARVRSPEERPSTNNSIGRVQIPANQTNLTQKTDRTGYIESEAFLEIRQFCQDALDWMHRERLQVAEKRRAKKRAEATTKASSQRKRMEQEIDSIPTQEKGRVKKAFQAYNLTREREVKQLKSEVQLYRTLSTAGITAAVFAHEAEGNPVKVIKSSVSTLKRRLKKCSDVCREQMEPPISRIDLSVDALQVLGITTLDLVERRKRRTGRTDIHKVIKRVVDTFHPFLDARSVSVKTDLCSGNPFLRTSEAAIESLITNLLNNALTAFNTGRVLNRQILIRTFCENDTLTIVVLDNGPGISGISLKSIWLPGETTRPEGTGLGLTIVRDTVEDLGGEVEVVPNGELGGAEFHLSLPILGV